ncbi:nitrite reductase small subunit NirD [Ectopseudomonas khazarica]|jgi:nitrite reductase (NADH) small subunit|uniref:nitrite reductase small subunit NirD n=1 Tax=Ectopseudomonas khazarica TaxID=2502979 RepID=UPI00106E2698|nr:nitrite reductase small subunit NirD [Pseudomonas khazarica]HIQ44103.1 nitrite reductase small subunit NirD [Pseudomonas oleovorans]
MSPSNTARDPHADWRPLCRTADLVAGSGIVALAGGQQVALFYLPDSEPQVFAIGNRDPKSGANVIGRGLVGHLGGDLVIASPLYKQHFRLRDGACLEYPEQHLPVWPVRLRGERVEISLG